MAKKNEDSGCAIVLVIIAFILAVLVLAFYASVLAIPPIIMIIGLCITPLIGLFSPRVTNLKSFELNSEEKSELLSERKQFDSLRKKLSSAISRGSNLNKRADGKFDERSKAGKELNILIPDLNGKISDCENNIEFLEDLPQKRLNKYTSKKSRPFAYIAAASVYVFIFFYLSKNEFEIVTTIHEYFTYLPMLATETLHGAFYGKEASIGSWWLFKTYTYKETYHAPMLIGSIASTVTYPIILGTFKAIVSARLGSGNDNESLVEFEPSGANTFETIEVESSNDIEKVNATNGAVVDELEKTVKLNVDVSSSGKEKFTTKLFKWIKYLFGISFFLISILVFLVALLQEANKSGTPLYITSGVFAILCALFIYSARSKGKF